LPILPIEKFKRNIFLWISKAEGEKEGKINFSVSMQIMNGKSIKIDSFDFFDSFECSQRSKNVHF
jgi:hypothetical protein